MSQLLNLARAAHLVGVTRGALQRMIRAGEIDALDGMITIDELLRVFPTAAIEDSGVFERVTRIREQAFGSRLRERLLPSQEVLAQRLFAQSQELANLRRYLRAYHELVVTTGEKLARWSQDDARAQALQEFLSSGLKKVLASEPAGTLDAMANMLQVISAQVTVRPSGHQFLVEGNDSILQAGLKAGLRFSYGCGSGTCGLCKARVVSGEVRQVQHGDYRLTEQERQLGYLLLCTNTAVSDVVVETLEARGPADIPDQTVITTVRAIDTLSPSVRVLRLQTPRSSRLRFLAGQSVTLGVATAHGDLQQTCALASCPCDERNLDFHISRDPQAPISELLFGGRLGVGDTVSVRGPVGDFVFDPESDRPLLLLACDNGFGPIKSLIEHAIASEQFESFALYWLATEPDGHYMANQCRAWVAAFDQFSFTPLVDADAAAGARQIVRAVRAQREDIGQCDVFVVGPAAFVESALQALRGAGARPESVRDLLV
jgi:CDP-4-dehydro-6-deoxyglucose reductase, E3